MRIPGWTLLIVAVRPGWPAARAGEPPTFEQRRPADLQGVLPRLPRRGREAQGQARPAAEAVRRRGRRERAGDRAGRSRTRASSSSGVQGRRDAAGREEGARRADRRASSSWIAAGAPTLAATSRRACRRASTSRRRSGRTGRSSRSAGPTPPAVRPGRPGAHADRRLRAGEAPRARAWRSPPTPTGARCIRRATFDLTGLPPTPRGDRRVPGRRVAGRLRAAGRPAARLARTTASGGAGTGSTSAGYADSDGDGADDTPRPYA